MTGGSMVRVRRRDGQVLLYGPMAERTASTKVAAIRQLAQDPRSEFAAATRTRSHGGAQELGHLIDSDRHYLFGPR